LYFFFSSRRRHTRSKRDWSSDVCSSDLQGNRRGQGPEDVPRDRRQERALGAPGAYSARRPGRLGRGALRAHRLQPQRGEAEAKRSEERRVGKEGRDRWSREAVTEKDKST